MDYTKQKPNALLVKAIKHFPSFEKALDIGAGTFRDSLFLCEMGLSVDAVDTKEQKMIPNGKGFRYIQKDINEVNLVENNYDVVNAQFVFQQIKEPKNLINRIYTSLKPGGIFVGQFFEKKDPWCNDVLCYSTDEAGSLLAQFEQILLTEKKTFNKTMTNEWKEWHTIDFIVKK